MRKIDVFGRKRRILKPIYILIVSFILMIASRYGMLYLQEQKINLLKDQESDLRLKIDEFLNNNADEYYNIDEIIINLPNVYEPIHIDIEIELLKNKHGLNLATNFEMSQNIVGQSPFTETLTNTIRFIEIKIEFTTDDLEDVLGFVTDIIDLDRIYYLHSISVIIVDSDQIKVTIIFYTFYNDVVLDN